MGHCWYASTSLIITGQTSYQLNVRATVKYALCNAAGAVRVPWSMDWGAQKLQTLNLSTIIRTGTPPLNFSLITSKLEPGIPRDREALSVLHPCICMLGQAHVLISQSLLFV